MRSTLIGIPAAALALLAACATAPKYPADLVHAKEVYAHALKSGEQENYPKEFDAAKKSISAAQAAYDNEAEFEHGSGPSIPNDAAYVALRRAEIADALGSQATNTKERDAALAELANLQGQKSRLDAANSKSQAELDAERAEQERLAREAEAARAKLAKFAEVREEERGTVITLTGGIPFATGKSDLKPQAVERLKVVAAALQGTDRTILITGFTDSQGASEMNLDLSQRRAATVKNYLVADGIPETKIRTDGKGEEGPVADNETAAGRAKNRRVEVVLEKAKSP